MKRAALVLFAAVFGLQAEVSRAADMGIVTGRENGTYFKFGQDISKYVKPFDLKLDVRKSAGSLENVQRIRREAGVQLGIVQADVLYFILEQKNDPDLKDYVQNLRMVFPLYDEEVHVLASPDLRNFSDLAGKRVAVGDPNSGGVLTSSFLFQITNIQPAEKREIGGMAALEALKSNQIDAMIYVIGQPAPLFIEKISENDKLQFLEIGSDDIIKYYNSATISRQYYSWLWDDVKTVAVKAILMSFDYRGDNCKNVGAIAKIISDNMQCLHETGHEKWRRVDLSAKPPKWPSYSCVDEALRSLTSYKLKTCSVEIAENRPDSKECDKESNAVRKALCRMRGDTAP